MVSTFYQRYSKRLLWIVLLSFPFLYAQSKSIPSNNDIETWLPRDSEVRVRYDAFKEDFGAEEMILIGISDRSSDDPVVRALSDRIANLPGIRVCWSPGKLRAVMEELDVLDDEISSRLQGFAVSDDGKLIGLAALLSADGLQNRAGTVRDVRQEIEYCQLDEDEVHLAGAPVVVSELDRLGNRESGTRFFAITLLICLCLLYYTIRQWKLTLSILGLTVWAISLTETVLKLAGGEMNFIMGALPVMVMVFTLAVSIHVLHYYQNSHFSGDALAEALRLAWKPCCLATLTTTIGLVSLTVSNIQPVRQFGYAAAIGSVVALLTGLGLTPAVLTLWPDKRLQPTKVGGSLSNVGSWMLANSKLVSMATAVLVLFTGIGLFRLKSKIDPLDFLPKDGKVLADVLRIERDLTNADSIEAVIDFGSDESPFVEKLHEVRRVEALIASHPAVRHTMSAATFLPREMPDSPLAAVSLLNRAQTRQQENDYVADGDRLWRISARINAPADMDRRQILDELAVSTKEVPISFTGISPLLDQAQRDIFDGFWKSFTMAFGIISVVMIVSLRSFRAGFIAMIPNLTPISIVFGSLGWFGFPVDIGMMMTGSIALGIAVDGTFHYLVRYNDEYARTGDSQQAARSALVLTGAPIFKAAVIAGIGMLALTLSDFTPTARFGYMMTTLLLAALLGDLVLLPCLLYLRPGSRSRRAPSDLRGPTKTSRPRSRTHRSQAVA